MSHSTSKKQAPSGDSPQTSDRRTVLLVDEPKDSSRKSLRQAIKRQQTPSEPLVKGQNLGSINLVKAKVTVGKHRGAKQSQVAKDGSQVKVSGVSKDLNEKGTQQPRRASQPKRGSGFGPQDIDTKQVIQKTIRTGQQSRATLIGATETSNADLTIAAKINAPVGTASKDPTKVLSARSPRVKIASATRSPDTKPIAQAITKLESSPQTREGGRKTPTLRESPRVKARKEQQAATAQTLTHAAVQQQTMPAPLAKARGASGSRTTSNQTKAAAPAKTPVSRQAAFDDASGGIFSRQKDSSKAQEGRKSRSPHRDSDKQPGVSSNQQQSRKFVEVSNTSSARTMREIRSSSGSMSRQPLQAAPGTAYYLQYREAPEDSSRGPANQLQMLSQDSIHINQTSQNTLGFINETPLPPSLLPHNPIQEDAPVYRSTRRYQSQDGWPMMRYVQQGPYHDIPSGMYPPNAGPYPGMYWTTLAHNGAPANVMYGQPYPVNYDARQMHDHHYYNQGQQQINYTAQQQQPVQPPQVRVIYKGKVGYTISNLPNELGCLKTPHKSPMTRSQASSAKKFRASMVSQQLFSKRNSESEAFQNSGKSHRQSPVLREGSNSVSARKKNTMSGADASAVVNLTLANQASADGGASGIQNKRDKKMQGKRAKQEGPGMTAKAADPVKQDAKGSVGRPKRPGRNGHKKLTQEQFGLPNEDTPAPTSVVDSAAVMTAPSKRQRTQPQQETELGTAEVPCSGKPVKARGLTSNAIAKRLTEESKDVLSSLTPTVKERVSGLRNERSVSDVAVVNALDRAGDFLDQSITAIKRCNCKGGQCRQLYCMCLKQGIKCDPTVCQCTGCLNDDRPEAEAERQKQIQNLEQAERRGCNCKRNYCKKNYCICHGKGLTCDPAICHCNGCHNYDGAPPVPASAPSEKGPDARKRRKNLLQQQADVPSSAPNAPNQTL